MKRSGPLAALFGICIVMTVMLLFFLPVFGITDIQINGNELFTDEMVKAVINNNNNNIFAFNGGKAIKEMEKSNYIKKVQITKKLPHTLVVDIEENKVRGYVEFTGSYLYLSDNGLVIDVRSDMVKPAPIIMGLQFATFTLGEPIETDNPEAFEAMISLSEMFEKYELMNDVLKVDISDPENIKFYCDNVQVIYGENDGSTNRLLTLIEILKNLDTSIPGTLDLTLENPTFVYTS